ncbi:MAG: DegQ family serine endoprotease [Rhodospirillaceae bacterium]|nr:DegQ family serine endoprotease [Rhodospirillaceae bacterium]
MQPSELFRRVRSAASTLPRRRLARGAAAAAGAALLGTALVAGLDGPAAVAQVTPQSPMAVQALPSFADMIDQVQPAVVTVSTSARVRGGAFRTFEFPFDVPKDSPFYDFFKQFQDQLRKHGQRGGELRRQGLGSGFIIDPSGYIVTNNHVIDGADEIRVTLQNGDDYKGKVVGADSKTDLALLKIDAPKSLPYVEWGDSDRVRVGDWVLAVGNPFGLSETATAGIVSARNRNIHAGPFDDFLQIDAPINQGNSGGPLFDLTGRVIGVNTAIVSPSGGSVGIGFAIPSAVAKPVIEQLRTKGTVERGWLGVQIQPVTPEIAAALGMGKERGALVASVQPDSPAAKADIRQGDVILSVDGRDVPEMRVLPRMVAELPAGKTVDITVLRGGKEVTVPVTIGKMKPENDEVASAEEGSGGPAAEESAPLGAEMTAITPEVREQFDLPDDATGVLITSVDPDGLAAEHGLRPGDIIESVSQTKVRRVADVNRLLEEAKAAKQSAVLLLINRQGTPLYVAVKLQAA